MRFALLFAVRLLIFAIVLAYVLVMLALPCIPVADATGEVQAVPRWEYWLLHASVPSAIWWQWTGGLQPVVISDRIPILVAASVWILGCFWTGKWISSYDPLAARLSKYERIGVSILIGQAVLTAVVFLHGTLLGTSSLYWLVLFWGILAALQWRRGARVVSSNVPMVAVSPDTSFSSSISRRMVGLLFLASAFLACVQVYGATIPTSDMQVREVDWWIVKHAALDGKIRWSDDHALANAPAAFDMPSLFFASVFTLDLPRIVSNGQSSLDERIRWNGRLKTSVLAGKTVNAMLCTIGVLLASIHLSRRWGILTGLFLCLILLSTPGISELTRLGRTEALIGIWCVALMVVHQAWRDATSDEPLLGVLWGFLLAGAISSGYGSAVLVGLPAVGIGMASRFITRGRASHQGIRLSVPIVYAASIGVALASSAFYLRNAVADGDPFAPWGKVFCSRYVGAVKAEPQVDALIHAHRTPVETVQESIDAASFESNAEIMKRDDSPYRFGNLLDGVLRLSGNSNAHGLMLIPIAVVGLCVGGFRHSRVAIIWVLYWMVTWWSLSLRLDRDWVGSLFLLTWPAAIGAKWVSAQYRGYFLFLLVSIAIIWSIVVIPIWPTSDNRILVALNQMEAVSSSMAGTASDRSQSSSGSIASATYSSQFNDSLQKLLPFDPSVKVLLVGESDDFDLWADAVSNGPFDQGWFDKWLDLPAEQMGASFRSQGISHLLVVWSGVRYREKLTGQDKENRYRTAIARMINGSQIRSIPWEMNSSQAELFWVNRE